MSAKCKKCSTTAYSLESISYDNETYHKKCFKCMNCSRPVSLGSVAMIQGDLYCKNCFISLFREKGSYHVFGAKTLPKSLRTGSTDADAPAAAEDAKAAARPLSPRPSEADASISLSDRRQSLKPVATRPSSATDDFMVAVRSKSSSGVKALIEKHGSNPLIQTVNGKTVLQFALGADGSPACAQVMIEALSDRLKDLEAEVLMLKDQLKDGDDPTLVASN